MILGAATLQGMRILMGVVVFAAAGALGYFASQVLPHDVLVPLLKYAISIIGVAWLFSLSVYNKLSDVTDISGLDFRQHRNLEIQVHQRLRKFWLRALFLSLLALTMYVPTVLSEAKRIVPDEVIAAAFGALALGLLFLQRLWVALDEIRALKSYVKELERREKERADQLKALKEGTDDAWAPDPKLDGFRNSASTTPDD